MVLVIVSLTAFSDGSAAPQNRLKVVASLTPYQSIATEIIGDKGTVESIAAARQDAHFVQARPSYSIMLSRADLLLATGLDLEIWMPAVIDKARKSVANFKLREGQPIGCHVTLRRDAMWEFLDRLTTAALPRIRDFRGINPRGFDGQGNYSMGVSDQSIFPEIELDKVKRTQGMDITIVTSARTNDEAKDLLTRMGRPFADK